MAATQSIYVFELKRPGTKGAILYPKESSSERAYIAEICNTDEAHLVRAWTGMFEYGH